MPGLGDPSYKQIDADPIMLGEVERYLGERATDPRAVLCVCLPVLAARAVAHHAALPGCRRLPATAIGWPRSIPGSVAILSAIDGNGLRDNTLVILTSDNGPETTAFVNSRANGRDSNGPLRGVKRDDWEGGTRVPFVVRWPGQIAAPGTVSNELIWQGDIFATVAAYLGADLPADVAPDGESFLNILRGQSKPSQRRDSIVVASESDHRAVITTDGWKLIDSTGGGGNDTVVRFRQRRHRQCLRSQSGHPRSSSSTCPPISAKTRNLIAGITDVAAIRSNLVLEAGGDLLARLDQYRTTLTSGIFAPFPDNDLDGMPNWFENRHAGLDRENPSDAALDLDGDGLTNLEEYQQRHRPQQSGHATATASRMATRCTRSTPIPPRPGHSVEPAELSH